MTSTFCPQKFKQANVRLKKPIPLASSLLLIGQHLDVGTSCLVLNGSVEPIVSNASKGASEQAY